MDLSRIATLPIAANRFDDDSRWPKRGSIVAFPNLDVLYRVAKVGSRSESYAYVYLVPAHEVPIERTNGSARSHYEDPSGYFQTDLASLSRKNAQIVVRNYRENEKFIEFCTKKQAQLEKEAAEKAAAYAIAPAGGIADRLVETAKKLAWQAQQVDKIAGFLEAFAAEVETEAIQDNMTEYALEKASLLRIAREIRGCAGVERQSATEFIKRSNQIYATVHVLQEG